MRFFNSTCSETTIALMNPRCRLSFLVGICLTACLLVPAARAQAASFAPPPAAWRPMRWSTLFTAQDVQRYLTTPAGRGAALAFCRRMHIRQVYLEIFRDGDQVSNSLLRSARAFFLRHGIAAGGMVATTDLGKPSTGWKVVACYTHPANRRHLREIFRSAAAIFPRILIDDFFFTDCTCSECAAARARLSKPGHLISWAQYRRHLMLAVSRQDVLGPAHAVNPRVRVVIKYPQWYDEFQKRGYRVGAESRLFDGTWIGTETRDPRSRHWGVTQQYRASLLPGWIERIAPGKLGGGWFDPYGTTPPIYLDQAWQTMLARLPEAMLFHYGELVSHSRPQALALEQAEPAIERMDRQIGAARFTQLPAYKPVSSGNDGEDYIYDNVGMLGIPVKMVPQFPQSAPMAMFATYGLRDAQFVPELKAFLAAGHTAILTSRLAKELAGDPRLPGFTRLERAALGIPAHPGAVATAALLPQSRPYGGGAVIIVPDADLLAARLKPTPPPALRPASLPHSRAARVRLEPALPLPLPPRPAVLRQAVLASFGLSTNAPLRVALYPAPGFVVADNFNDHPASFTIRRGHETLSFRLVPPHTAVLHHWR